MIPSFHHWHRKYVHCRGLVHRRNSKLVTVAKLHTRAGPGVHLGGSDEGHPPHPLSSSSTPPLKITWGSSPRSPQIMVYLRGTIRELPPINVPSWTNSWLQPWHYYSVCPMSFHNSDVCSVMASLLSSALYLCTIILCHVTTVFVHCRSIACNNDNIPSSIHSVKHSTVLALLRLWLVNDVNVVKATEGFFVSLIIRVDIIRLSEHLFLKKIFQSHCFICA